MLGIYYMIRHKASGEYMPELRRGRGYSHWNPSKPDSPNSLDKKKLLGTPRLLPSRRKAAKCIAQWNCIPNGRQGYGSGEYGDLEPDDIKITLDGRTKEDLEIVEVELSEVKS